MMRILIAEDDPMSNFLLKTTLANWGHEVIATVDGGRALEVLQSENPPQLAILDWMMPVLDGTEVCRRLHASSEGESVYIIMLTTKAEKKDMLDSFAAGADDYLTKPFDAAELKARVGVGIRMVEIQQVLHNKVLGLEAALGQVKQLQGILPICSYCKHVRDDQNYWQQVEAYVSAHSEAQFSHSICPACYQIEVQPLLDEYEAEGVIKNLSPD